MASHPQNRGEHEGRLALRQALTRLLYREGLTVAPIATSDQDELRGAFDWGHHALGHDSIRAPVEVLPPGGLRGRDPLLGYLSDLVVQPGKGPRLQVLYGLGGSGKTAIALEVARRAIQNGIDVWWVTGTTMATLRAGLLAIAYRLGASAEELLLDAPADVLWRRLGKQTTPWVLVIDDADEAASAASGRRSWVRVPPKGNGLILVTTRDGRPDSWGPGANLIPVTELTPADGARVLIDLAPHAGSPDDAARLSQRLAGLPLALNLAGSYLASVREIPAGMTDRSTVRTFSGYLAYLDQRFLSHAGEQPIPGQQRGPAFDVTISTTWEISLDHLQRRGLHAARPLLRLLSCFGPAPIPYVVLVRASTLSASPLFSGLNAMELWNNLLGLAQLGLIKLEKDEIRSQQDNPLADTLSIHPLVREINRNHPEVAENFDEYLRLVTVLISDLVRERYPLDTAEVETWLAMAAHGTAALQMILERTDRPTEPEIIELALETAIMCAVGAVVSGWWDQADEMLSFIDNFCTVRGYDSDPSYQIMAQVLRIVIAPHRRMSQTAAQLELLIATRRARELYGDNDLLVLGLRGSLALAFAHSRWRQHAALELRDIWWATETNFSGDSETDALVLIYQLAFLRARATKATLRDDPAAVERELFALADAVKAKVGETHVLTVVAHFLLGAALMELGRLDTAEAHWRQVHHAVARRLSLVHPITINASRWLSLTLERLNRLKEAEYSYRRSLEALGENLGPDHPLTLVVRRDLAQVLEMDGRYGQALDEYSMLLELMRLHYTDDSEELLSTRLNVAQLLNAMHRPDDAEREFRAVIDGRIRTLGGEHPETLSARIDLGGLLVDEARYGEAAAEFRAVQEAAGDSSDPLRRRAEQFLSSLPRALGSLDRPVAVTSAPEPSALTTQSDPPAQTQSDQPAPLQSDQPAQPQSDPPAPTEGVLVQGSALVPERARRPTEHTELRREAQQILIEVPEAAGDIGLAAATMWARWRDDRRDADLPSARAKRLFSVLHTRMVESADVSAEPLRIVCRTVRRFVVEEWSAEDAETFAQRLHHRLAELYPTNLGEEDLGRPADRAAVWRLADRVADEARAACLSRQAAPGRVHSGMEFREYADRVLHRRWSALVEDLDELRERSAPETRQTPEYQRRGLAMVCQAAREVEEDIVHWYLADRAPSAIAGASSPAMEASDT
jgi:tetratricopeptide (TPR) repeat protein